MSKPIKMEYDGSCYLEFHGEGRACKKITYSYFIDDEGNDIDIILEETVLLNNKKRYDTKYIKTGKEGFYFVLPKQFITLLKSWFI